MTVKNTIEQRSFVGTVWGGINFFFTFLQVLILVPILLKYWGPETYGMWLSLYASFVLLQTIDTGHQAYLGNEFNKYYHTNIEKIKEILGSGILIAGLLGVVEIAIGWALIELSFFDDLLGISQSEMVAKRMDSGILIMLFMWLLVGSVGGILAKLYIPTGLFSRSVLWGIISKVLQLAILIVVALSGYGIFEACLFTAITLIIYCIFLFNDIRLKLPNLFPWWERVNIQTGFKNLSLSIVLTFNSILQQLSSNGIIIMISSFLGAAMVPIYTTIRTLVNTANQATNIIMGPVEPELIRLYVSKEIKKVVQVLNANWLISGFIVNAGMLIIIPFVKDLFIWWTNNQLEFNNGLFYSLCFSILLVNHGSGLTSFLRGLNHLTALTYISISRALIIISLSVLGINLLGLVAIGYSTILSEIFASVIIPFIYVKKELTKDKPGINLKHFYFGLLPILCTGFVIILGSKFEGNKLILSAIGLLVITLIYIIKWNMLNVELRLRLRGVISSKIGVTI